MKKRFIIVLNAPETMIKEIRTVPHRDNYIIFQQNDFLNDLPKKLKNLLIKNGLFMSLKTANNPNNSLTSLHRLVMCLYVNILGLEVHHIYKNKQDNNINSLLHIRGSENKELELLGEEISITTSLELQETMKKNMLKPNRNTLAQNPRLVKEILISCQYLDVKALTKKFSSKVKKSSIYKILAFYFYKEDFLKWLKINSGKSFSELCGKLGKGWENILKFERIK